MPLALADFVHRWKAFAQTENAGSQPHFLDLCELLGQPHPAAADSAGENYAFEKHIGKAHGGRGFADVWLRDHFAWEYKGKHKSLEKAYIQLNDYREELGNPPLLVVCDLDRFEVHTNFTATSKRVYAFNLDDLNRNQITATCPLPPLEVLRALFGDYNVLRPEHTDAQVTNEAAKLFSRLAERLELENRNLGASREQVAHFLMRLLFCLFADSVGLLPDRVFRNMLLSDDRFRPRKFLRKLTSLFEAMSERDGVFGPHSIRYFNGGLFDSASVVQLDEGDLGILYEVAKNYDWAHIAPAIFGTLFERSLDPKRRSLIGAHYTSEADILTLIEPVLVRPLQQRWQAAKQRILEALEIERAEEAARDSRQARLRVDRPSEKLLGAWIEELAAVRVLDPACGSGNFLYVALRKMLDLWLEARNFAAQQGISLVVSKMVSPSQLYGIETEFYAHELASIVVWIGFLQWKHEHGVLEDREPILEKLNSIEHGDAIMRYDAEDKAYEPEWPQADFIIGNPPFLGGKRLRRELGDKYVDDLFARYEGRVKAESDLVVYWFEKTRAMIELGNTQRAGLIATQSIRNGANSEVLSRILSTGGIFEAWSDREWVLGSAQVRISLVAFDNGSETQLKLDGAEVAKIYANLQSGIDVLTAKELRENKGFAFQGPVKVGKFEISDDFARYLINQPNPHGRSNAEVIKPWINGGDITKRPRNRWIIDFGKMSENEAALFEAPFEHLKRSVREKRLGNNDKQRRENWWRLGRSGGDLKGAIAQLRRMLVTSRVSSHRFFIWCPPNTVPDSRVVAFAADTDYFAGMLHSRVHLTWFLAISSRHGVGNDPTYNSETCFDTFPFPWPPGTDLAEEDDPRVKAIADAARELVRLRDAWLNPPKINPDELSKRTLTNLYNARPDWLANAHRALDEAVFAAYGWPSDLSRDQILSRLLELNHQRAAAQPTP